MDPTPSTPLRSLPARVYTDPAVWEQERERVFGREWLLFGHELEWPKSGDARAAEIAGRPVFVRRARDGALHGFHNVCRHRAGPLLWEGETRCEVLRCRYHGWVYDEEGRLARAPHFDDVGTTPDPDAHALVPLRVETWRGLVFVCLDPAAPPLDRSLAPLEALVGHRDFGGFHLEARASHPIACDWKVYVENYLEGYHVPSLHPRLRAEIDWRSYRVEVHGDDALVSHHSEPRAGAEAPVYDGLWAWLAPNAALNVYGSGMSLERMTPLGPGRMQVDYLFLFRSDEAPARAAEREAALSMCAEVTDEDRRICEAVQRNLAGGIYRDGPLSPRHENGVAAFQRWWRTRLGDRPAGS